MRTTCVFVNEQVGFFVDMEQCDRFLRHYFTTINDIHPQYALLSL